MESKYNVIAHSELCLGTGLLYLGGSATYDEDGYLTFTVRLPYTVEELEGEIERIQGIKDPETGDLPQHCLDAIEFLKNLKLKLGWQ